jgi:hypothetical protein
MSAATEPPPGARLDDSSPFDDQPAAGRIRAAFSYSRKET